MDMSSRLGVTAVAASLLMVASACAGTESSADAVSGPPLVGTFLDCPVSGLDFQTDSERGTTSTWVGAWGFTSRKATASSVCATTSAGMSPATILQNRQAGSVWGSVGLTTTSSHAAVNPGACLRVALA